MEEKTNLPPPGEIEKFIPKVTNRQSNLLVESRQEFSLLEKKMILCMVNQVSPDMINIQKDLFGDMYFKVPVSIFGENYGFHAIKKAVDKITTRNITAYNEKKQWAKSMTPVPLAEFQNGVITLMVQKAAVHLFVDLKQRGYSQYALDAALSLTSVYSQRMYELLSRWKDTGKWLNVEIDHLKFLLGIDKKKTFNGKAANGKLKSKIIEPAMAELAEKTDIVFNYEFIKEGREFKRINFYVATKALIKHIEKVEAAEDTQDYLEQVKELPPATQAALIETALLNYNFKSEQKKLIKDNGIYRTVFMETHSIILNDAHKTIKFPSAFMAAKLRDKGWR